MSHFLANFTDSIPIKKTVWTWYMAWEVWYLWERYWLKYEYQISVIFSVEFSNAYKGSRFVLLVFFF